MLRYDRDGVLISFSANNMREPRLELGCPKAPDPKSSTPPTESPNHGPVVRTEPHDPAPSRTTDVTESVTRRPLPTDGIASPHRFKMREIL